jgi:hypothetical protein
MSIRMKTFVIMLSVCLFFTVANLGMGLIFTQEQLAESIQSDMGTVADIANMLVSREITLLKAEANVVAQTILRQSLAWTAKQEASRNMNDALAEQAVLYENFLGLAIVDPYGVHAFAGTPPSTAELKDSIHVQAALQGTPTISTSRIDSNGQLVFYVCVPMGDRVLTATVSGMHFCKLLSERFRIFETGNIFLLDSEGIALADMRSDSVQSRLNFLDAIQTDPRATDKQRREVSEIYEEMASGQPGVG